MNRRNFIGAIVGAFAAPAVIKAGEGKIQGVGVLRHPDRDDALQQAKNLASYFRPGSIIGFPNTRDSYGAYEWDFRIEGGDPGQVRIVRHGEP